MNGATIGRRLSAKASASLRLASACLALPKITPRVFAARSAPFLTLPRTPGAREFMPAFGLGEPFSLPHLAHANAEDRDGGGERGLPDFAGNWKRCPPIQNSSFA